LAELKNVLIEQRVFNVTDPAQVFALDFNKNRDLVVGAVAQNVKKGGVIRKSLTRSS
jgi:hypothetical protein